MTIIHFERRERVFLVKVQEQLKQEREAVDTATVAIVTLFRDLMDEVSLSGDNPQLLMNRLNRFILTEDGKKSFINWLLPMADIHCNGIIDYLDKNCPALTRDDLTLCALICFGFPSHSLQRLFNQNNSASLYNMRSRIRRKIGIPEGESTLEKYLQTLEEKLSESR